MSAREKEPLEPFVIEQFLPLVVRGISMNDGSISFGCEKYRIVLGYITNACSFGDFVSDALKTGHFGREGSAITQMKIAGEVVRLLNAAPRLVKALGPLAKAADNYADCDDEKFIDDDATITVGDLREARAALAKSRSAT